MRDIYRRHSVVTDPGAHRDWLAAAPAGVDALAELVRGLVVHRDRLAPGLVPTARLDEEPRIRRVTTMLGRIRSLDPGPVTASRPATQRLVGHCRSTSVLLCALLRERDVPARTRCGFSVYYAEGRPFYGDHWVTEYWHSRNARWQLVDAELDEATRAEHGISFDPLDVPRTQLLVAAEAWRRGRVRGDWDWYGRDPQTTGRHYVGGQLLRDAASLGREEVGAFDNWLAGDLDEPLLARLDEVAAATRSEAATDRIAGLWAEHPELRPPVTALADG